MLNGRQKYFKINITNLIMPKREDPDYVGIWEGEPGNYGLFLFYINEKSKEKDKLMISGDILDTLGLANFSGFIEEDKIYFSKVYAPEKSSSTVLKQIIEYKGWKKQGGYNGTWFHNKGKGTFVLEDMVTVAAETSATSTVASIVLKHFVDELHEAYKKNKK